MQRFGRLVAFAIEGSVVACATSAWLLSGCGNDFDALFGDAADADASPSVVSDGGTAEAGDASTGTPACARVASCPLPTEDCEGGTCNYACTGCGCACTQYTCRKSDGISACNGSCAEGTTCGVSCGLAGPCAFTCDGCNGSFDCAATSTSCTARCTAGSTCATSCSGTGPCKTTCEVGASCTLRCGASTSCALDCATGPATDCGGGVFTCGRACP